MGYNIVTKNNVRDRFAPAPRPEIWKDTPDKDWNNWIWQQQKRIKSMDVLEKVVKVDDDERNAFAKSHEMFNMGITPYYASLMDPNDPNCPIRLQSVPKSGELNILPMDLEDPLGEERDMPVPGVTHRYPDRVLFYTTHNCPVYCRHCTRKRKVSDPSSSAANKQLEDGLAYIESHKEIRDVVISGGDPLSNSDDRLEYILSRLRAMDHIQVFRIGTRNLVTLPQRITDSFAQMLSKYHPVFVHTHFNHPKECTQETFDAVARLANAGCVVNNQMVLLKGVNDDAKIVKELNHKLLMMRVRPYYIFQCDMSQGISHFRTPVEKGLEIIENLRGWTSGMAVPHYVIDAPGGGGKIPLLPQYLEKREGKKWHLRNFRNQKFVYEEP
ncbi:MAG: KamA family radical SAM protein [Bdellovibrionales bacterium]|nr:KamA family radical SAM protein [Bdellovibrionales bacterium]